MNTLAKHVTSPYKDGLRQAYDNDLTEAERALLLEAEAVLKKVKTFVNWAR